MPDRSLVIGVDVGTTGAKAVLTSDRGEILTEHSATYEVLTPRPAGAEQWPDVGLDGLSRAVRGLVEKAGVDTTRVRGMAVSSLYGGSGIPVDDDMARLHPCLIWGVGLTDRTTNTGWVHNAELYRRYEPNPETAAVYREGYAHFVGLYRDLRTRFAQMAGAVPT